jgi:hypothetical protein
VDAPLGTEAIPIAPPSSDTCTLTVGLPLESKISNALTDDIFLLIAIHPILSLRFTDLKITF